MDLKRIHALANIIATLQSAKFTVKKESYRQAIELTCPVSYDSDEQAAQIASDLNAVIAPVLRKYEKEMRNKLAECGE